MSSVGASTDQLDRGSISSFGHQDVWCDDSGFQKILWEADGDESPSVAPDLRKFDLSDSRIVCRAVRSGGFEDGCKHLVEEVDQCCCRDFYVVAELKWLWFRLV